MSQMVKMPKSTLNELRPHMFRITMIIGKGHNDKVLVSLGQHKESGHYVAVKRILLDNCEEDFARIQKELVLMNQFQHVNVLPVLSAFSINRELWIINPFMEYGSCTDLMTAHFVDGLPESCIAFILREVLKALHYLHSSFIIHRSVQASHILVGADGSVCLSGLRDAYSMMQHGKLSTVYHFPINNPQKVNWMAPEILEQNLTGYGTKSDIYSLGITACELANGYAPFSNTAPTLMLLQKVRGLKPILLDSRTISEFPDNSVINTNQTDSGLGCSVTNNQNSVVHQRKFSKYFHSLISNCLEKDPSKRPTASSLLVHSMFKPVCKNKTNVLPKLLYPLSPFDLSQQTLGWDETETNITDACDELTINCDWDFD